MPTRLYLGDEAVAQGALDAGVAGAFSYPGTPATEVFEHIQRSAQAGHPVSALWSANEKVAYEEALGMSYAGRRAVVSMKHVGLNVASDPFINSALTGVNAGLVLVVADDPGMHSSQNEQDSRYYAEFAHVPMFEPATQQEAYDLTRQAFELSERIGLPVLVRLVTRLAHSRANVAVRPLEGGHGTRPPRPLPSPGEWTLVPSVARRRFARLLNQQASLVEDAETSGTNRLTLAGRRGVIAAGVAHNYVVEALDGTGGLSILKIAQYPLPVALIRRLVDHCTEILVAEDGYAYIESRLNGVLGIPGKAIRGRLTGDLPRSGELGPDGVARALGRPRSGGSLPLEDLAGRPPQLCNGCPHADTFKALVEATAPLPEAILFSDIGCYTLGVLPPYRAVHACVDMGASIAMAHGATRAGARHVVCTIGDSTFSHSGMTGLVGAARSDADMTVLILDNATVAMTGTQESFTCGERLLEVIRGLGVSEEHLRVIEPIPSKHRENVDLIRRELEHRGLSVIVAARPCIHLKRKQREPSLASVEA